MDEHTGARHQTVDISGSNNSVLVVAGSVYGTPPPNAFNNPDTADQGSGRKERNRIRPVVGISIIGGLVILAAAVVIEIPRDASTPGTRSAARAAPPILRTVPIPTHDAKGDVPVSPVSGGERLSAPSLHQQEAARDPAARLPPPTSAAVPPPAASGGGRPRDDGEIVRTDGRSIFADLSSVLPGACTSGVHARLNGKAGSSDFPVGCVNGELVVRVLDAPWAGDLNPNTLYCLGFALPGERPIRFLNGTGGLKRMLTPERYIGFRIDVSVENPENRTLVLTNTPGTNGTMPCSI